MPGLRLLLQILPCWLFCAPIFAGTNPAGLSFYSNDLPIAERTRYDVFDGYRKTTGDSLVLAFDLSVTDPKDFGHIMDLFSKTGEEFNLVLVNFRDDAFVYVDFNEVSSGIKLSFPIARSECRDGSWHRVRLLFDRSGDKIELTVNDSVKKVSYDFDGRLKDIMCIFGRSAKYTDVPRMAIRNLRYEDGRSYFNFLFTETSGETVYDIRGAATGSVECPDWMANRHYYWKKEGELWQGDLTYISHDSRRHAIVGYNYDSTFVYDLSGQGRFLCRANDFPDRFRVTSGGLFFDETRDEFIVYNALPKPEDKYTVARYDYLNHLFTPVDRAVAVSKLHHHNVFTDSRGENLYLFGGYGNYSYSGAVYVYSFGTHRWREEAFSGDTVMPRFFAASGADCEHGEPGVVYLFGGFGNRSGRQEDGARNLYDLYRVDVDRRHIRRIFDMECDTLNFVPAGQLVAMPGQGCFYVFAYDHNMPRTKGYVYRVDMDGHSFQRVSDGIDIVSEKIDSKVYFFYDAFYQKMICVTQENVPEKGAHITLYTLSFPPCAPIMMQENSLSGVWMFAGLSGGVLLLAGGFLVLRRRKKELPPPSDIGYAEIYPEQMQETSMNRQPLPNSVWLLGDFCVFDRNARDITYRFSSKIRQLFLLVLLNSGNDSEGISSAEISLELWPEKEDSKNIRGVTVKALRDVLADLDGVDLMHENHKWRIAIDPGVCTCDYTILMNTPPGQVCQGGDPVPGSSFRPIDLLMRGSFMPLYNYKWMDSFKFRFEEHMERLIRPQLDAAVADRDYPSAYRLASCLQFTHPLNEEYLRIQLKALKSMGRYEQALSKFRLFAEEYRKSYGTEPNQESFL